MGKYVSYEQAGVSIDANDEMVDRIQSYVAGTFGPRVYDERLFKKNYKNPVLVACTDGVGSKVQLAVKVKRFDTVGIDLVAMSVNDMLVQGAEPLFFLDYIAVNKLEPELIAELVKGVASGCRLAGFAVGVVERKRIVTGSLVRPGDVVLGLASNGLHSNGYTLVRNICFKQHKMKMTDAPEELGGRTLGEALLEPTRIYVRPVVRLLGRYKVKRVVHAMAHITGGGLVGNIPRVLPKGCNAVLQKSAWPVPEVFAFLQERGPIEEAEMLRVFNMGIGYVLVAAEDFADSVAGKLTKYGERVYRIGRITTGVGKVVLK